MRRKARILWFIGLCCLLGGCTSPTAPTKPTPFIPPHTMRDMMVDIYQLEGELRVLETFDTKDLQAYGKQRLDTLLQTYGYSWEEWKANYAYYMTDKKRTEPLMEQVSNRLTEMESRREKALADLEVKEVEVSEGFMEGQIFQ
ncbi:MAG: DUF4296 domain-containing protein [Bacteroidales bacterium]|nr:DUF4296 domain-containing protein [Bacteroidales bacterium]